MKSIVFVALIFALGPSVAATGPAGQPGDPASTAPAQQQSTGETEITAEIEPEPDCD